MKSEFGKITGVQLLNALYYFVGTLAISVVGLVSVGTIPTLQELIPIIGTASITSADIHYECSSLGSNTEYTK